MTIKYEVIRNDLRFVLGHFPREALYYLRDNRQRLIRGVYTDGEGNGCLFWLLSRTMPTGQQIESKLDLVRFFTGGTCLENFEKPDYQPARWLVRAVDGKICPILRERYGDLEQLEWDFVFEILTGVLAEREALEKESLAVEASVAARLSGSHAEEGHEPPS